MKIFITASFKGKENKDEIEELCNIVKKSNFQDFCFIRDVENYEKMFFNPKELMLRAKEEISKCDALLIDLTNKPTGRAIEAGIAYTLNKKIITIFKKGTKLKDTSVGISDLLVEYEKIEDIIGPLKNFLKTNV